MPSDHLDFALRIRPATTDGEHSVHLLDSPVGDGDGPLGLSLEAVASKLRASKIPGAARSATSAAEREATRPAGGASADLELQDLGNELFAGLFGGELADRFALSLERARTNGQRLRVILKVDLASRRLAEIHSQPWEYLRNPKTGLFLSAQRETPVIRLVDSASPVSRRPIDRLRILAVASSPQGVARLDVEREIRGLERLGAGHSHLDLQVLHDASLQSLRQVVRDDDIHVLHYMGHGDFDRGTGEGTLALTGDGGELVQVTGSRLAQVLGNVPSLRLVVLNACRTAESQSHEGKNPFAGVGTALVHAGVPAVVAMQAPISDTAAIAFSETFYGALAAGEPLDVAMSEARLTLLSLANDAEWGTPVLFTATTDLDLFPRPANDDAAGARDTSRRTRTVRRGIAALVAVPFLVAGWLATRPATEAEIVLDAKVDGVAFRLGEDAVLFEEARFGEVGAGDLGRVELPPAGDEPRQVLEADGERPLRLSVVVADEDPPLRFDPSYLPAAAWIELATVRDLAYRLGIDLRDVPGDGAAAGAAATPDVDPPVAEGRIQAAGPIELRGLAPSPRRLATEPGSSIELAARGSRLDLDVTFRESAGDEVGAGLPISGLQVSRVEERTVDEEISHRRVSTLSEGELATAGGRRTLSEGELLRFASFAGSLTSLRLHAGAIHLTLRGRVTGLTAQPKGGAVESLMPRRFETWWSEPRLASAAGS